LSALAPVTVLVLACSSTFPESAPEPTGAASEALTGATQRINCGGSAVAPFGTDTDFSGGNTINQPNTIDVSHVTYPAPAAVYQTARVGNFTYTIPGFKTNSNNTVRLHFAETSWPSSNSRLFNVGINGTQVLSNFDVFLTAGAKNRALIEEFTVPANSSGAYAIQFTSVKDKSLVSGIEVVSPCANGAAAQYFGSGIVGCNGSVTWANRASLCGTGSHVASATEWATWNGGSVPTHDYWTDDNLTRGGTGPSSCSADLPSFDSSGSACDAGQPMRVCTPGGNDAEGNQCTWTNCGLDSTGPNLYFGGCSGTSNRTAGSLCARSACANGVAAQQFSEGMIGCPGSVTWPGNGNLCAPDYHVAGAVEWSTWSNRSAPVHDYWTADPASQLGYSGSGPSSCAANLLLTGAPASQCPANQPPSLCTPSGTDPEGNRCTWSNCGLDANSPNAYFGQCNTTTAGALCLHGFTPVCPSVACETAPGCSAALCAADCAQTSQICEPMPWPNGVIYYQVFDPAVQAAFDSASSYWNRGTAGRITFVPSTTRADRVHINDPSAPWSCKPGGGGGECSVGYGSAGTQCCWAQGISANIASHELGHVIGLHHEHSRGDRDRYVEVIPNNFNCQHSGRGQFADNWWKCGTNDTGSDFGVYETQSVMHYSSNPPYYILSRASPNVQVFQSGPPTPKDASNVEEMYGRSSNWGKFLSLSTDAGGHQPLQVSIPSPPATSSNVTIQGRPAFASQGGFANLDAYVRGSDGHIYHRYEASGTWFGYDDMGAPFTTDPAATSWGSGSAILVAGNGAQLSWKQFASPSWGSWQAIPAPSPAMASGSSPAVVSWAPGTFHVFILNVNNALSYIRYANGAWGSWTAVPPGTPSGVTFAGNPTVASQGPNSLDVFINSSNGHIWHTFYVSTGWRNQWEDNVSGAALGSSPAATSWGPGRVDLFFQGTDHSLKWKYYALQWKGPYSIGGLLNSSPIAVAAHVAQMDVLSVGTDGGLWRRSYIRPRGDYDGDGKADPVLFRPSDGKWHIRKSSDGTELSWTWGASTDKFVPGAYGTLGLTDVTVFRPSEGNWYFLYNAGGTPITPAPTLYGNSSDRLVPGDYDGDGRTDIAYWEPSTGNWHIQPSGGGNEIVIQFGQSGDQPVPGDYDGDGKNDAAIFRPSTNTWYAHPSGGGNDIVIPFGTSTDKPLPGDYDGDGKTDAAYFRPSEGNWHIHRSSDGGETIQMFGTSADRMQPADFDGDGKTDIALFRPSDGNWYIHTSAGGNDIVIPWGTSTDIQLAFVLP
jgi:hypothetical protein